MIVIFLLYIYSHGNIQKRFNLFNFFYTLFRYQKKGFYSYKKKLNGCGRSLKGWPAKSKINGLTTSWAIKFLQTLFMHFFFFKRAYYSCIHLRKEIISLALALLFLWYITCYESNILVCFCFLIIIFYVEVGEYMFV